MKLNKLKNNEVLGYFISRKNKQTSFIFEDLKDAEKYFTNDEDLERHLYQPNQYSGWTINRVLRTAHALGSTVAVDSEKSIDSVTHEVTVRIGDVSKAKYFTRALKEYRKIYLGGKVLRSNAKAFLKRFFSSHVSPLEKSQPIKLNLGAGGEKYSGYLRVDWAGVQDVYDDITSLKKFRDGCVTEIYSNHVLEHIPTVLIEKCLRNWHRVLKVSGEVRVRCPDARRAIQKIDHLCSEVDDSKRNSLGYPDFLLAEARTSPFVWQEAEAIQMVYGWGENEPFRWDMVNQHKSLWTPGLARKRFEQAGFKVALSENVSDLQTYIVASK